MVCKKVYKYRGSILRSLLKRVHHKRQIRKNKFLPVIAYAYQSGDRPDWLGYAYYHLSMYQSAAALPYQGRNWKFWLAYTVSLAACGESKKARRLVNKLLKTPLFGRKQKIALADSLAPFSPVLALAVLDKVPNKPPALYAALLLRLQRHTEAQHVLSLVMHTDWIQHKPELHLLMANASLSIPAEQLCAVNRFMAAYGLDQLRLKNTALPLGAGNLSCYAETAVVDGPLVSILVTAFRSAERIGYALDSLLQQTYRNIEIVVMDDAGDDDTGDIVKAIIQTDARVRYVKLSANVGTFAAKNMGIRLAKGEFITCHDSDDWAHPRKIELQIQPLLLDLNLVYTTSQWVRVQDDGIYYARPVHPLIRLNPASPLFRKKMVLEKMGGWDWVRTGADSEFSERLKLVFGAKASVQIKKPLTFGAHRADSLMTAPETGYDVNGISQARLAYWEAWRAWHIECFTRDATPLINSDGLKPRQFTVPKKLMISTQNLKLCQDYIDSLE